MSQTGAEARKVGDAPGALANAAKKVEAVYEVPFLAHAPMEPLNATAHVTADHCAIYASTQGQSAAQQIAARVTGLRPEQIEVHTEYLGGGFGRRGGTDYIGEAVDVSKATGAPVTLTGSRAADLQQDHYRPASYARFAGAVDAEAGRACSPAGSRVPRSAAGRAPRRSVADLAYAIPHVLVDYHAVDMGIPVTAGGRGVFTEHVLRRALDELIHATVKILWKRVAGCWVISQDC